MRERDEIASRPTGTIKLMLENKADDICDEGGHTRAGCSAYAGPGNCSRRWSVAEMERRIKGAWN